MPLFGKLGNFSIEFNPGYREKPQGFSNNNYITLIDNFTSQKFIVDTGSCFSLIPSLNFSFPDIVPWNHELLAANNSSLEVKGSVQVNLKFDCINNNQPILWQFLVANVPFPIIGMDFLKHFDVLIDCVQNIVFQRSNLIPPANNCMHSSAGKDELSLINSSNVSFQQIHKPTILSNNCCNDRGCSSNSVDNQAIITPDASGFEETATNCFIPHVPAEHQVMELDSTVSQPLACNSPSFSPDKDDNQVIIPESSFSVQPILNSNVSSINSSEFSNMEVNTPTIESFSEFQLEAQTQFQPETAPKDIFKDLLNSYPEITGDFNINSPIKHNVVHRIDTIGQPVRAKCRRLNPNQLIFLEGHLQELLRAGIIEHSESPWASAIHLVSKSDSTFRVCGDYRPLNAVTVPDSYPPPFLQDFTHRISGSTIFSKLDLKKAYFHIPIHQEDIQKTSIITPLGAFSYRRLNFGLKNAVSTWMKFINQVLSGMGFTFAYLDDILIFSNSVEAHLHHLKLVFDRLRDHGLLLNVDKCTMGVTNLDFLGHNISIQGISPQQCKINAIKEFPVPTTQKQLRNFLGLITFYHRFIPGCADILSSLNALVIPGKASNKLVVLNGVQLLAFNRAKDALVNATLLVHPNVDAEISVACDASLTSIAGVLQQKEDGIWKPLGFCSRKLTPREQKYSVFSRELLAIHFSIKKFRYYLEGRQFCVFTDHKPISSAIKSSSLNYLPREFRQLEFISQFTSDIRYIKGTENVPADALTRACLIKKYDFISYDEIANEQEDDEELERLKGQPNFDFITVKTDNGVPLWVDRCHDGVRPYVPAKFRYRIFEHFHKLSHPGIKATRDLICKRFLWPFMKRDIKDWITYCEECQKHKITRHTKTPLQPITEPDKRFEKIHLDIVHLPICDGYRYLLTVIDRFSRWTEAIPLEDSSAETVINKLINAWISRYGVPKIITNDNASIFLSRTWLNFLSDIGVKNTRSSLYHPISQGIIERFHRTLKQALNATGISFWVKNLPWVLLSLRSTIKTGIEFSPAEILYGTSLRLPCDFFEDSKLNTQANLPVFVQQLKERMRSAKFFLTKKYTNTPCHVSKCLSSCSHVYVRNDSHSLGIKPTYLGPFKVLERTSKYMKLEDYTGIVSLDRVKPAFISNI